MELQLFTIFNSSIHLFRGGDDPGVIVCVGSTGTGKSSTIARVTGAEVKSGAGKDHT